MKLYDAEQKYRELNALTRKTFFWNVGPRVAGYVCGGVAFLVAGSLLIAAGADWIRIWLYAFAISFSTYALCQVMIGMRVEMYWRLERDERAKAQSEQREQ